MNNNEDGFIICVLLVWFIMFLFVGDKTMHPVEYNHAVEVCQNTNSELILMDVGKFETIIYCDNGGKFKSKEHVHSTLTVGSRVEAYMKKKEKSVEKH